MGVLYIIDSGLLAIALGVFGYFIGTSWHFLGSHGSEIQIAATFFLIILALELVLCLWMAKKSFELKACLEARQARQQGMSVGVAPRQQQGYGAAFWRR